MDMNITDQGLGWYQPLVKRVPKSTLCGTEKGKDLHIDYTITVEDFSQGESTQGTMVWDGLPLHSKKTSKFI